MAKALTPADIGNIGERHATAQLEAKGWICYRNTQLPGATDIEAIMKDSLGNVIDKLLVQVKTAISPYWPSDLSSEERAAIIARARRNGPRAYLAQISINDRGDLLRSNWEELT